MKKFLLDILLFLLAFVVVNLLFLLLISKYDWNFSKRLEAMHLENPEYSCLVIGNSYAMDGIDTKLLSSAGYDAYNLSIGGASVRTNYLQLKDYLARYSHTPEKVILALDGFRHDFKSDQIHPIIEATTNNGGFENFDIPLIKFRWMFTELLKKLVSAEHRNAELVQGQLRLEKVVPDKSDFPAQPELLPFENFKTSVWVESIAALCRENKIELVIIEMPAMKKKNNGSPVGPHQIRFKNGDECKLYNFNSMAFQWDVDPKTDWIGNSHLNKHGAAKFTRALKSYLEPEFTQDTMMNE